VSGQNESDLPVIPGLKFLDDDAHVVGDLPSPTASFEASAEPNKPAPPPPFSEMNFKDEVKAIVLNFLRKELS
jgi:hypothetical protein